MRLMLWSSIVPLLITGCISRQCDEMLKTSSSGDIVIAEELLRSNPRLANCKANANGETPLNEAAYNGSESMVELLIEITTKTSSSFCLREVLTLRQETKTAERRFDWR